MKRQFYLDEVERDLLRNALALWRYRLEGVVDESAGHGHHYAKHFTLKRIKAMEDRLKELPEPAASEVRSNPMGGAILSGKAAAAFEKTMSAKP